MYLCIHILCSYIDTILQRFFIDIFSKLHIKLIIIIIILSSEICTRGLHHKYLRNIGIVQVTTALIKERWSSTCLAVLVPPLGEQNMIPHITDKRNGAFDIVVNTQCCREWRT